MNEVSFTEAANLMKPELVLFVISRDKLDKPNIMTASWGVKCSFNPGLFAVAISKENYTNELIKTTKEFVISVPNKQLEKYVNEFGNIGGQERDKLKDSKLATIPGKKVKLPMLKDATINLECILDNQVEVGDHTLFIGKVVAAHCNPGQKVLAGLKGAHGHRVYEEF